MRPYLAHFVKTYSAPLLQEVAAIWGEELTEVGASLPFGILFLLITIVQVG
jgi:hypothetical protein